MTRAPLASALRHAFAEASARETGLPKGAPGVAEGLTRREFLTRAGTLGVGLALAGTVGGAFGGCAPESVERRRRVVVVGAGLAGLTCAHRLERAGVDVLVHEAAEQAGGRCKTLRGYFAGGQHAELGGEFIDSGHAAIRGLAREFGLELVDLRRAGPGVSRPSTNSGESRTLRKRRPKSCGGSCPRSTPTSRQRATPRVMTSTPGEAASSTAPRCSTG